MSGLLSAHNFADNCEQKVKNLRNRLAFFFKGKNLVWRKLTVFKDSEDSHFLFLEEDKRKV